MSAILSQDDALPWVALRRRRLRPPSNSFAVGPTHPRPTSAPILKSCGSAGPVGSATSWTHSGTWKQPSSLDSGDAAPSPTNALLPHDIPCENKALGPLASPPSYSDRSRVPTGLQVPGGLARSTTQQEPAQHRLSKGRWSSRGSPRPLGCGTATAHVPAGGPRLLGLPRLPQRPPRPAFLHPAGRPVRFRV